MKLGSKIEISGMKLEHYQTHRMWEPTIKIKCVYVGDYYVVGEGLFKSVLNTFLIGSFGDRAKNRNFSRFEEHSFAKDLRNISDEDIAYIKEFSNSPNAIPVIKRALTVIGDSSIWIMPKEYIDSDDDKCIGTIKEEGYTKEQVELFIFLYNKCLKLSKSGLATNYKERYGKKFEFKKVDYEVRLLNDLGSSIHLEIKCPSGIYNGSYSCYDNELDFEDKDEIPTIIYNLTKNSVGAIDNSVSNIDNDVISEIVDIVQETFTRYEEIYVMNWGEYAKRRICKKNK